MGFCIVFGGIVGTVLACCGNVVGVLCRFCGGLTEHNSEVLNSLSNVVKVAPHGARKYPLDASIQRLFSKCFV